MVFNKGIEVFCRFRTAKTYPALRGNLDTACADDNAIVDRSEGEGKTESPRLRLDEGRGVVGLSGSWLDSWCRRSALLSESLKVVSSCSSGLITCALACPSPFSAPPRDEKDFDSLRALSRDAVVELLSLPGAERISAFLVACAGSDVAVSSSLSDSLLAGSRSGEADRGLMGLMSLDRGRVGDLGCLAPCDSTFFHLVDDVEVMMGVNGAGGRLSEEVTAGVWGS